jgi:hypothetical protein
MKKFMKIALIVLSIIAIAAVILSFMGPKDYFMSRKIHIAASDSTVWNYVNLWEKQKSWSPWVAKEPTMKITIEGTDGSVGSKYSWVSETQGKGYQIIAASEPMKKRTAKMNFGMGMESFSDFILTDSAGGTGVEWTMYGENGFMGRIMGNFMDFEKFVGPDYEQGLKNLKKICETP